MSIFSAILITSAVALVSSCQPQSKPVQCTLQPSTEVRKQPTEQELAQYRAFKTKYGDLK